MVVTFLQVLLYRDQSWRHSHLKEHVSVVLLFPSTMGLFQEEMSVYWDCVVVVVLKVEAGSRWL